MPEELRFFRSSSLKLAVSGIKTGTLRFCQICSFSKIVAYMKSLRAKSAQATEGFYHVRLITIWVLKERFQPRKASALFLALSQTSRMTGQSCRLDNSDSPTKPRIWDLSSAPMNSDLTALTSKIGAVPVDSPYDFVNLKIFCFICLLPDFLSQYF